MRKGWYTDKYFVNITHTLNELAKQDYHFAGRTFRLNAEIKRGAYKINTGDLLVEMQFFTRRKPQAIIVGVDMALSMLRHCTGYSDDDGQFNETWHHLDVEAIQDGDVTHYDGDVMSVQPVIRVRGRYRDFALLETPMLGALTRGSRVATNVYNTLVAARGKPVLFFPARFDTYETQAIDGYAYHIAVERFNLDYNKQVDSYVSTDAQGSWWGGHGGGTIAHAAIACFLGDTAEAMLTFSATQDINTPRIALVDFNNDSVEASLAVIKAMFKRYKTALENNDETEAKKYQLFAIRLDTSGSMRDICLAPLGDKKLDNGVNPRLVWIVRQALDTAWHNWDLHAKWQEKAKVYCQSVRIVVSGGFNLQKIKKFESLNVAVDIYGVGSSLMSNDSYLGTNTDFTADVVKIKINNQWLNLAKIGRWATDNPNLAPVNLDYF